MLQRMSLQAFNEGWTVKVHGSWNLFQNLPADMDFHVMFSSCVGVVGGPAQSNYVVGNVFQDALAHYARNQKLRCTTLDLGVQLEAGFVAENAVVAKQLSRRGFSGVLAEEFLRLLDMVCTLATRLSCLSTRKSSLVWTRHKLFSEGA